MKKLTKILIISLSILLVLPATLLGKEVQDTVEEDTIARLDYIVGDVKVDTTGMDQNIIEAQVGDELGKNAKIITGFDSSVELVLRSGSVIKISENSEFIINELTQDQNGNSKKSLFSLVKGKVRAVVAKLTGDDESFEITTPNGVASVRGTDFGVTAGNNNNSDIIVLNGAVEVTTGSGSPVMVASGKMVSIIQGGVSSVVDIPESVKKNFTDEMGVESETPEQEKYEEEEKAIDEEDSEANEESQETESNEAPSEDASDEEKKDAVEDKAKSAFEKWLDEYMNLFGEFGTIVIDGKIYSTFTFNSELTLGNIGLGLYFPIIYDPANGGILSPKDWYNADEFRFAFDTWDDVYNSVENLFLKISYLRINEHDDDFYFKVGNINDFVIGNGTNVYNFSNMIEFPQQRYLGVQLKFETKKFAFDLMTDNLFRPNVIGLRPGIKFLGDATIGLEIIGDIKTVYDSSIKDPILGSLGAGVLFPLIKNNDIFSMFAYADVAVNYYAYVNGFDSALGVSSDTSQYGLLKGFGAFAGIRGNIIFGEYRLEYRNIYNDFIPQLFGADYLLKRTENVDYFNNYVSSNSGTWGYDNNMSGLYFDMNFSLFDKISGVITYAHYFNVPADATDVLGDTLVVKVNMAEGLIPNVLGSFSLMKYNWDVTTQNAFAKDNFLNNLMYNVTLGYQFDGGIIINVQYYTFFQLNEITKDYDSVTTYSVSTTIQM